MGDLKGVAGGVAGLDASAKVPAENLASQTVFTNVNYTATDLDAIIQVDSSSGTVTITLPDVSPLFGRTFTVAKSIQAVGMVSVKFKSGASTDLSGAFVHHAREGTVRRHRSKDFEGRTIKEQKS